MATPLQPLTLSELLDRTFQLYRRHFFTMVVIVGLPNLLTLAVQLVQQFVFVQPMRSGTTPGFGFIFGFLGWMLVALFVQFVTTALSQGATVVAVSRLYLGETTTVGGAYAGLRGRVLLLIMLTIVLAILLVIGFILLIIPGVILLLMWAFVPQVAVVEREGFGGVMNRSMSLTEGGRWRLLAIYVLFFVLNVVFASLWQVPVAVATIAAGAQSGALPTWIAVLGPVGTFVAQCLAGPLLNIAITLAYYDARVRHEAFDLQLLMARVAPEAEPVALP